MSRIAQPGATSPLEVFTTNSNLGGTYNYVDLSYETYVGQKFTTADGRVFVLVQNGGAALAAGKLVQSVPNTAAHIGLTVTAFTAYTANGNQPAQVTATLASTGVLPNEYAGGYLMVSTGTGLGQYLKIASHPGLTAGSADVVFTLENPDGQNMTALDTTSTVSLFRNKYGSVNGGTASTSTVNYSTNGVIICPTTITGTIVGLSTYAIPASTSSFASYGLIQTHGPCAALNHSGTTIGLNVGNAVQNTPVAGAVETYAAASNILVGYASQAGTDTHYNEIFLTL